MLLLELLLLEEGILGGLDSLLDLPSLSHGHGLGDQGRVLSRRQVHELQLNLILEVHGEVDRDRLLLRLLQLLSVGFDSCRGCGRSC